MPQLRLAQRFVAEPTARWGQFIPLIDLPPTLSDAIARLRVLSQLPDDWDGYGSPHITSMAKQSVMALLSCMRSLAVPSMRMDPVSGGGVQLEWEIGPRSLEIEILPDGSIEFLLVNGNDMLEGPVNDQSILLALLRWLMRC